MIQAYFNDILQSLIVSHIVLSFKVLKQETVDEEGFIRIKCTLANDSILEFAEYVVSLKNNINVETYSYHWQKTSGILIKRWDNVPHHKEIDSFPHHLHLADDKVVKSTQMSLKKVLAEIEKTLIINNE